MPLSSEQARELFHQYWPMVLRARRYDDVSGMSEEDTVFGICSGVLRVWAATDGVVVGSRDENVCWLAYGSGELGSVLSLARQATCWYGGQGCNEVLIYGRPGWSRILESMETVAISLDRKHYLLRGPIWADL